jgi:hypothetical protein
VGLTPGAVITFPVRVLEDVLKVGDYCKKAHKAYAEI